MTLLIVLPRGGLRTDSSGDGISNIAPCYLVHRPGVDSFLLAASNTIPRWEALAASPNHGNAGGRVSCLRVRMCILDSLNQADCLKSR